MNKVLILFYFASTLFMGCKTNKITQTEVTILVKTSESWNGTPLPAYATGRTEITILKIIIPPKTSLELHKHSVINAGVLLKGKLTVISVTNDTLYLKAGEPIIELVNTWHYGKNESNKPAEIIVFYAGVQGKPITVLRKEDKD
jgi:quercetin dioxygenase-like cupin family protein